MTIDVAAADPHLAAHAEVVTTAIAAGPALSRTKAVRELDHRNDIFAIGYVIDNNVLKRFPRRLLLPAAPPKAGEHTTYFNITGTIIEKRFDGTQPVRNPQGREATGYAFSDYLTGQRNTIVYLPALGVASARFYNLKGTGNDLICQAGR